MAQIMIIDDEEGIRELFSEILIDEGHQVLLAENAAAARQLRSESQADLIFLDIWMPDTDGVSLLKEWSQAGTLDVPVVMMSGHGTIDTAVEATRIGAVDYLEKPVSLAKLLETVETNLKDHQNPKSMSPAMPGRASVRQPGELTTRPPYQATVAAASADHSGMKDEKPDPKEWRQLMQQPLREAREGFEKLYFETHLRNTRGNLNQLASFSGLERSQVHRKLKQLGLKA